MKISVTEYGQKLLEGECNSIRAKTSAGRPLGGDKFLSGLEKAIGRDLRPKKRGPKSISD